MLTVEDLLRAWAESDGFHGDEAFLRWRKESDDLPNEKRIVLAVARVVVERAEAIAEKHRQYAEAALYREAEGALSEVVEEIRALLPEEEKEKAT
jgi:hypothetical protein